MAVGAESPLTPRMSRLLTELAKPQRVIVHRGNTSWICEHRKDGLRYLDRIYTATLRGLEGRGLVSDVTPPQLVGRRYSVHKITDAGRALVPQGEEKESIVGCKIRST